MPTTAPSPVQYPLGPPVVNGPLITVDMALKQPTRVTRRISDLTLQNFITTRIFATGGQVTGGAVVYDQITINELYTSRDVQQVAPGREFPIVGANRQTPNVALVEKWGGKFEVTDESRDRNDTSLFNNQVTQLSNTIVRKVNQRAVAELQGAVAAVGSAATFVGHNWGTVITAGTSATSASGYPAADFAGAQLAADTDELGVQYDLWLVNPKQLANLKIVYGSHYGDLLDSYGISEVYASNRIPNGTAYAVARGMVGEMRVEKPLSTETWREPEVESTWVQSSVRPVVYVTNPYSVKQITGLDG